MSESTVILNAAAIQRALTRIAHEIAERNEVGAEVVLVGIPTGGVPLAQTAGNNPGGNLEAARAGRQPGCLHAPR
ncbi:MAG: hypothetical protein WDM80_11425 [Limisphaerales bacterium]